MRYINSRFTYLLTYLFVVPRSFLTIMLYTKSFKTFDEDYIAV